MTQAQETWWKLFLSKDYNKAKTNSKLTGFHYWSLYLEAPWITTLTEDLKYRESLLVTFYIHKQLYFHYGNKRLN